MNRKLRYILFGFLVLITNPIKINAQDGAAGIGISVPVQGEIENGSLVCGRGLNFALCDAGYDPDLLGVVTDNAAVALEASEAGTQRLVVADGVVRVRVSTGTGVIAEGDFLTSSEEPGVAQKATGNGYVLGTALEAYDVEGEVGFIPVAVNIHLKAGFTGKRTDLFYLFRQGLSGSVFEPLDSLRYLLAVIVVLVTLVFGTIYFGRVARAGVEAMGRNPLARSSIRMGILLSIMLSFVMIIVGLALAYLILIL